jgi:hypothetical protein
MNWSTGRATPPISVRGESCSTPSESTMLLPGGIT